MVEERAGRILQILRETFTKPKWFSSRRDPFETLVVTIISQNTADINTARAFENLSKRFRIRPEVLANAETKHIEECLKVAGLYRNKAKTIKNVSKIVTEKFHGDMDHILSLPFEEARKTLLQIPGVGPKTADVVLLFYSKKPTIPVDTHIKRVAKRLGLAPVTGNYEVVRESLQSLFNPEDYLDVHILLILLGRKFCRARKPLCELCVLNAMCPKLLLNKNA
ncbi:MAG: endonuclease III domain-containing protein [Candidatus Bathyarchaeia archaeon]